MTQIPSLTLAYDWWQVPWSSPFPNCAETHLKAMPSRDQHCRQVTSLSSSPGTLRGEENVTPKILTSPPTPPTHRPLHSDGCTKLPRLARRGTVSVRGQKSICAFHLEI
jgi:hypothetical protein